MLRKCVGCNELKPRENLIKITKNHTNGELFINPNSKTFGRSAYLCYNKTCIEKALKKNKLNRALKNNTTTNQTMFCEELKKLCSEG